MYQIVNTNLVRRLEDGALIPNDLGNTDYQAYLAWRDQGNLPSLPDMINSEIATIEQQRDLALAGGVMYKGHLHHTDNEFRIDLSDMIMGFEKGFISGSVPVRTLANEIVMLSYSEILELKLAIGMMRQAVYAQSWTKKDTLRNS